MQDDSSNPYRYPEASFQAPKLPVEEGDATGGIIPYKNPHALIAYYLGIVSLFPLIGIPFGVASIILGFIGLSKRKANPVIKGSIHAWIGIILGFCSLLCGAIFAVLIGISVVGDARR